MGKLLLFLASLCLAVLLFGTAATPDNAAFWLASNASGYEYIRAALLFILLVQLFTNPPRHVVFRYLCGVVSISVSYIAIAATYDARMELLDTFSLLAAAIAIGVTALEMSPKHLRKLGPRPSADTAYITS